MWSFLERRRTFAGIRFVVGFLAAHIVIELHGEDQNVFRHDISTVVSVSEPISPDLAERLKRRMSKFIDHNGRTINRCKGVYKATLLPDHGVSEWAGYTSLLLLVNQTNDVQLFIAKRDDKYMAAPLGQPGFMTDRTLFFGPTNAGICFFYQSLTDELRTILSPLGLQKVVNFRRVDAGGHFDKLDEADNMTLEQGENKALPAVINHLWYLNNEMVTNKEIHLGLHDEKMRNVLGTYVLDDKSFLNGWGAKNVDKWYFVINSATDVDWIEEVNGSFFFELESRPGSIDEMFIRFGTYDGTSFLYKCNGESLSVILNYAMGFYDDDEIREVRFSELERKGLFQRKLTFRRTQAIPPDLYPTRSRTPREAFFPEEL